MSARTFDELPNLTCKDNCDSPSAASTRAPSEASTYSARSSVSSVDGSLSSRSCRSGRSLSARSRRYRPSENSSREAIVLKRPAELDLKPTPRPPSSKRATSMRRRPQPKPSAATSTEDHLTFGRPEAKHVCVASMKPGPVALCTITSYTSEEEKRKLFEAQMALKTPEFAEHMTTAEFILYMQRRHEERSDIWTELNDPSSAPPMSEGMLPAIRTAIQNGSLPVAKIL